MSQTAVVVGATGVVGRALVDRLSRHPNIDQIRTLTRRPAPHPSAKVDNRVIDFDHLSQYGELMRGDLLFSCLGTTKKQAGSIQAQRKVDVTYQWRIAELAAEQGVGHYLLVSASGADAHSRSPYLKMKGELEQRVQSLPFNRISLFQPSLLLGQRSDFRPGETLAALVMPLLCRLPGLRRYRPILGDQVAAKMVAVSQSPGHPIETFRLDALFDIEEHR
ncbi:NAD-dependent epimerase/dehydratase family protein [Ferrimonas sediminicola]|uniref:NAD-dependent epimerase/dehydratase family protein n=1 Tax=Ferrimonas sediminicola TaxID=2569538 RepID=A0A4U1BJ93_9GAMM|nr:NAD(P)H-binding protein [Ferrimonas sediminicola]TKB51489.1 NAD-dependent epimerase/dehydratase family protein [Ferrimonas sediminicola]